MSDGLSVRGAIAAAEKKRQRQYTPKQKKFLTLYAKNDFRDSREIASKAGINASDYYRLITSLKDDIVEIAGAMLLGAAPEAALALSGILNGKEYDPGNGVRLNAAKEILDRVGIVKEERINHDHKVSGGLFIIPAKIPLPQEDVIDGEVYQEVSEDR